MQTARRIVWTVKTNFFHQFFCNQFLQFLKVILKSPILDNTSREINLKLNCVQKLYRSQLLWQNKFVFEIMMIFTPFFDQMSYVSLHLHPCQSNPTSVFKCFKPAIICTLSQTNCPFHVVLSQVSDFECLRSITVKPWKWIDYDFLSIMSGFKSILGLF